MVPALRRRELVTRQHVFLRDRARTTLCVYPSQRSLPVVAQHQPLTPPSFPNSSTHPTLPAPPPFLTIIMPQTLLHTMKQCTVTACTHHRAPVHFLLPFQSPLHQLGRWSPSDYTHSLPGLYIVHVYNYKTEIAVS